MNVYKHELRTHLIGALGWALALSGVGLVVIAMFPVFGRDMEPLVQMLKSYPPQLLAALGIDQAAVNSFNGFYSFMFVFILLCAAIMGLTLGISVISKEGARKTSDFLFTRPLSRVRILAAKYLAMLTLVALVSLVYVLVTYRAAKWFVADFDPLAFGLFSGAFFLTTWLCLSIGFCVGCCARRIKAPNALGIAIGAMLFALLMVDNLSERNSIAFISPLSYLNPRYIAQNRAYDAPYLFALIALSVILVAVGVARYKNRDIHAA